MINFDTKPDQEKSTPEEHHTSSVSFNKPKQEVTSVSVNKQKEEEILIKEKKEKEDLNATILNKSINSVKPFHTEADTKANNICNTLLTNYPQFMGQEQRLKNMIKQLITTDLTLVTSWGEEQIIEQRNLVSSASNRIREFNALNGNELLKEVLDYNKESYNQTSFLKRLASKFSDNAESYNTRVTALRMQVESLLPILNQYNKDCKNNLINVYLAVLATVDDELKDKEKLIGDAFYNRRMLLNGALANVQMLSRQLDQTLELVSNMLNEISHIMDVVLPALKMKG